MVNNMFQLDRLLKDKETDRILGWNPYYQNSDINIIYDTIELSNIEQNYLEDCLDYEVMSYRILIDNRVFAFVDTTENQLNFMRNHYNTNEKCKPRYTCDEYVSSKVKKKGGKRK